MPENNAQAQGPDEQNNTIQQVSADTIGENKPAESNQNTIAEKTFTQSEVNDLVKSRLERERKNMPSKDELAAFKKWQDEQKTAEEKHAEAIKAEQQKTTDAELRASEFEAKYVAMTKGVKPEAVEDVIALAKVKVSDDVTLEQAIDAVVKKYPSFSGKSEIPANTGIAMGNNAVSAITDETKARAVMGLPPRN